jgi:histidinol-phosphate aminotransferase
VAAEQVLVTRGSSEAIDLIVRCFCRPGLDNVIICPPTFGMYEVYAQLQGAGIIHVPLDAQREFALDVDAVEAAWTDGTKLVFVCSPNNPTGNRVPTDTIHDLAKRLAGRGLVILDEAYAEFADDDPTVELLAACDNVVVLRTLSKALGLAGIRCGAALAAPVVVDMLGCILPPYCYPTPSQDAALASLAPANRGEFQRRVELLRSERGRVASRLAELPDVDKVWPSEANFLLVRLDDPAASIEKARAAGFLLRNFSWDQYTPNCLRITIGTPEQNDALLEALANQG